MNSALELNEWQARLGLNDRDAAALLHTPYNTYRYWVSGRRTQRIPWGLLTIATAAVERQMPEKRA